MTNQAALNLGARGHSILVHRPCFAAHLGRTQWKPSMLVARERVERRVIMGAGATGINPICQRWWSQLRVSFWSRAWASENRSIRWSSRRRKVWSVVGSCVRVNWNETRPRLLADVLRWDERSSAGARILVWKQQFQGVGDIRRRVSSRAPCFPPLSPLQLLIHTGPSAPPQTFSFPPSSACIVLTAREQFSFASSPTPSLVFGWFASPIQQDLGTHPHLNRYCWIVTGSYSFNDQFPGYMNVGNWHQPGHGHGHRPQSQNAC